MTGVEAQIGTGVEGLPARRLAKLIAQRELSSEELVRACLDRIEARDQDVKAWQYIDPELAVRQARARDAESPSGPLHGLPVGIKDIIETADMPTEYGTSIRRGHRPQRDAACVQRLLQAGAVLLGKTVTTEFATKHPAGTTNPHNPGHTPGGSSSGSAAAVAADMVPFALGTQTVGSTVRPAVFCGVFGMKPTWGAVDMAGVNRTSHRLDTIGIFAREAGDLELLLGELSPANASARLDRPAQVGAARTPWWDAADRDSAAAFERAIDEFAAARARVEEVELPSAFTGLLEAHDLITVADLAACLASEYETHPEQLSDVLRTDIERGQGVRKSDYDAAVAAADHCRILLSQIFEAHDVLLVPAVTGEAPRGLGWTGDPIFCRPWSLLGPPAIGVPVMAGSSGLPVGVQLVGPHAGDATVARLAATFNSCGTAASPGGAGRS